MGTRRSKHNKGRKPLYKEFRSNAPDYKHSGISATNLASPGEFASEPANPLGAPAGTATIIRFDCAKIASDNIAPDAVCDIERMVPNDGAATSGPTMGAAGGQGSRTKLLLEAWEASRSARGSHARGQKEGAISRSSASPIGRGGSQEGSQGSGDGGAAGRRWPALRGGCFSGTNMEGSAPAAFKGTGVSTEDKTIVIKRLGDAAARFWPKLEPDERRERVHITLIEILERERDGEEHKISWWAKWMFRRTHDRAVKFNREFGVEDISIYSGATRASQFNVVAAKQALELVALLPPRHRRVIELLAEGANPLEISDETEIPITSIIGIIRDARSWLDDGGCYLARTPDERDAP